MIRRTLALATLLTMLLPGIGNSQNNYNLELISNVTYSNNCFDWYSDVWGFQHSNGTEYAVVGAGCHTLVYDLSNPTSPALIAEIEGDTSVWRDMKSYGDYIYAIADQGDDGLLVIDLTNPTDPVDSFFRPTFGIDTLIKGHNLYIDDSGFIYIAGSNINSGGVVIYHIGSDPFNPDLAGIGSGVYAHDVFVNDNLMITSELGNGFRISSLLFFGTFVFPVTEAVQETTNDFTHNAWTNGGASVCYTTDERSGAFVEAYDISDFGTGIELLDKYAPPGTIGSGVIPHNVQVAGDYLVVSYYRDGVKLVDATDPYNLVEVGSY
ncbi:MAG: hypothetical protein OEQ53_09810, partial [Saprospiraceae bacterium]|nr:hypothetical protein [Saprospiraceae bacterium]